MPNVQTPNGRKLNYKTPPGGSGWTTGRLEGQKVHVFIRPSEDGGGVFLQQPGGRLVHATTGEQTIWFNNRLWTDAEEQEEMERIKTHAQD